MKQGIALLVAAATTVLGLATTAAAQDESSPEADDQSELVEPEPGAVTLELIDQSFDLGRDGDIELTYRLTGDLSAVAELAPPTTTTTTTSTTTSTTTTPTTTPTTTLPAATEPPATEPGNLDPAAPTVATTAPATGTTTTSTTTTTTTTTTEPPPPPVALTFGVLSFRAIDEPSRLAGILGPNPLSIRLDDSEAVDGIVLSNVRQSIDIESADSAIVQLSVPTDSAPSVAERLEFNADGIHPILVQFRVDDQTVAEHGTVVERRALTASAPATIDLSLIASIGDPGPTADDATIATAVDQLEGLIDMARDTAPAVTLKVPPSVATAAAATNDLPADVRDVLVGDELLAGPATPFNVSSAVQVQRVESFQRQLNVGEDDVRQALGIIPVRDVWLATEPLSAAAAQVLADLGVRYLAMPADVYRATVAMAPGATLPHIDRFVDVTLPDGSTMPTLIIDEEFGAVFTTNATNAALAERHPTEWVVEQVAGWRLEQFDDLRSTRRQQRSHLFAVPGLTEFDPRLVNALEAFALQTEAIRFSPASVLASVTDAQELPEPLQLPETAGPSLVERLDRIALVQADLADTTTMLPSDDPRPIEWTRRLDSFVSTAFDDEAVFAELDELSEEAARLRSGVIAPQPFTFTLTGREGSIELQVGNRLDEPLRVVVRLSSPRLNFPDGDVIVVLPPDETTVIDVAVEARSNGTSPVTVEIVTPSAVARPLIEPVILTSRVNALTGFAQLLTAALVLILLAWWISSWRSKRRDRDSSSADATDASLDAALRSAE